MLHTEYHYEGYRIENDNTVGLSVYGYFDEQTLPFDEEELVQVAREQLDGHSGLVEAVNGETKGGNSYSYYIVKRQEVDEEGFPQGVSYRLNSCISQKKSYLCVDGVFWENGMSGMRDAMVFAMFQQEHPGDLQEVMELWKNDPYNPSNREGFLMNASERRDFDILFPEHPLSVARKLIVYLINQ